MKVRRRRNIILDHIRYLRDLLDISPIDNDDAKEINRRIDTLIIHLQELKKEIAAQYERIAE